VHPGVRPVGGREEEESGDVLIEIGPEFAQLPALAKEAANPLLVPPALGDDLVQAFRLEVLPLLDEDSRHLELLGDDAQVGAQGEADLLRRREVLRNGVEARVKRVGALPHGLVEEVLLAGDVGVERALLDAHGRREVADRRPVVALLRE
jgi:hypothetical protein